MGVYLRQACPLSAAQIRCDPLHAVFQSLSAPHIFRTRQAKPGDTEMATLQNFDAEIAKTKQVVEDMRSKIEQSGTVLDKIARTDEKIGAQDFDIENARIEDVLKQQKVMEGNIADLIIGLEDATN